MVEPTDAVLSDAAEAARLQALYRYGALDSGPEESFDRIARLVRAMLGVPIALVSLIDRDRQYLKANAGLAVRETSRDISFCTHAIRQDAPMLVEDASEDPRFRDNPLVTDDPGIRFYLGAPLHTHDGHKIGTLCAIDRVARVPTRDQVAALQDLARLVMDELELRRIATTDSLTGAMTRRHFLEQSGRAIAVARRYGHPAAAMLMDLDHFKRINDTHGHPAGDAVLRQAVARLRETLRAVDMVGRMGGEEFAVFLPETDLAGAAEAAERLREAIAVELFRHDGAALAATGSFGVAMLGADEQDAGPMLRRADIALYRAKRDGRNRVAMQADDAGGAMPAVA